MKVAILGYGKQGYSSYQYFKNSGADLTIHDANLDTEVPDGVASVLGEHYLENLDIYDVLVRSPGIHPREIVAKNDSSIISKITSNTNEFFKACPTKHIIGVTGTKGKGTTTSLIAKLLEADNKITHVGGNIGTPPLELLTQNIQENDWVVLELGNTQLIDLHYSPTIAVCLMVVPEHLDWHTDLQEYYDSKKNICSHQTAEDKVIFFSENEVSAEIAKTSIGTKVPFFQKPGARVEGDSIIINEQDIICPVSAISLKGKHNQQNVCAALTATWDLIEKKDNIEKVINAFSGLPHRLEFVREKDGHQFYNDSFAATPEAGLAAIEAIEGMKVMIMGGFDRNLNLGSLVDGIIANQQSIRKILLMGQSAPRFSKELAQKGFDKMLIAKGASMNAIIQEALQCAEANDTIVLSSGFPSFDMFKNFEDRGEQFKAGVLAL